MRTTVASLVPVCAARAETVSREQAAGSEATASATACMERVIDGARLRTRARSAWAGGAGGTGAWTSAGTPAGTSAGTPAGTSVSAWAGGACSPVGEVWADRSGPGAGSAVRSARAAVEGVGAPSGKVSFRFWLTPETYFQSSPAVKAP
ncbi:hypothetical protein GCM10010371_07860 [Streptomyces subrutilus]|uniref:Uncharacterized protein n=1 Tax=Streptomyces subrutilus TaxID=36818 RepID=A0A918V076_9ACTN|nr:hypothetical protein GCM10010371_07860 [Streptomyces subrutilus]